jgi:hypothetical protein
MVAAHLYVCIYKNKNKKIKDNILRGRKERVTIWFWLVGCSYKAKLKNVKKKKKTRYHILSYIFAFGLRFLFRLLGVGEI